MYGKLPVFPEFWTYGFGLFNVKSLYLLLLDKAQLKNIFVGTQVQYAYSNLAGCSIDATCQVRVDIL